MPEAGDQGMIEPGEADKLTTLPHVTTGAAFAFQMGAASVITGLQAPPITELNKAELELLDLAKRVHNLIVIE
jgi:hypothetical protein